MDILIEIFKADNIAEYQKSVAPVSESENGVVVAYFGNYKR